MRSRYMPIAVAGLLALGLALGASLPAGAFNLSSILGLGDSHDYNIKKIHVPDLVALMHDKDAHVVIMDANLPDVRAKYGVIPGAKLLSSPGHYNVAAELPADKQARLVFYCTNLH